MGEGKYAASFINRLKIEKTTGSFEVIPGLTSITPENSKTVETFFTFENEGWQDAFVTSAAFKLSASGVRKIGDEIQDKIAALYDKIGTDCELKTQWVRSDGKILEFTGVFDVKNIGGGDANGQEKIEFDLYCKGKPEIKDAE